MRVPELLRHRAVREWGPGSRSSVHVFISPENYRFARQLVMGRLLGNPVVIRRGCLPRVRVVRGSLWVGARRPAALG